MKLSDFSFDLPDELIAHYPTEKRTQSRLMALNSENGAVTHDHFLDLPKLLQPGDLLVLNNTKVMPARLFGKKSTGGKVEILVERVLDPHHVLAHCKASKRPKVGTALLFGDNIEAIVMADNSGLLNLKFTDPRPIVDILFAHGHIPLPLYIRRPDEKLDKERYQTVYANPIGSVAAPTAGLHFDQNLLAELEKQGVKIAYITLHIGAGTFQPVRVENLDDHIMHAEYAELSPEVVEQIKYTKQQGKRVIAVGTTTTRTLEAASCGGQIQPFYGETRLFIKPGFEFQCVDAMITNFHLPESTLLMLVCAFGGYHQVMHAYREAVAKYYRFFSYGDAMFITKFITKSMTRKNYAI